MVMVDGDGKVIEGRRGEKMRARERGRRWKGDGGKEIGVERGEEMEGGKETGG